MVNQLFFNDFSGSFGFGDGWRRRETVGQHAILCLQIFQRLERVEQLRQAATTMRAARYLGSLRRFATRRALLMDMVCSPTVETTRAEIGMIARRRNILQDNGIRRT
jgi:hypothetical protein